MTRAPKRVPVKRRALEARIRRALDARDQRLCRTRSEAARLEFGEVYVVDTGTNVVLWRDVDLEQLGRDLDVLHGWEVLADD